MSVDYLVPILFTDDAGKTEIVFASPAGKWYRADGTETEAKVSLSAPRESVLPLEVIRKAQEVVRNA